MAAVGLLMAVRAWRDSAVSAESGRGASGIPCLETGDYSAFRINSPLTSFVGVLPSVRYRTAQWAAPSARFEYRLGARPLLFGKVVRKTSGRRRDGGL
jgi:hypothetical protein